MESRGRVLLTLKEEQVIFVMNTDKARIYDLFTLELIHVHDFGDRFSSRESRYISASSQRRNSAILLQILFEDSLYLEITLAQQIIQDPISGDSILGWKTELKKVAEFNLYNPQTIKPVFCGPNGSTGPTTLLIENLAPGDLKRSESISRLEFDKLAIPRDTR